MHSLIAVAGRDEILCRLQVFEVAPSLVLFGMSEIILHLLVEWSKRSIRKAFNHLFIAIEVDGLVLTTELTDFLRIFERQI